MAVQDADSILRRQGDAQMAEALITDEMIASMRARAGTELRIDHSVYNEEATALALKRFAGGIGDPNPLWLDEEAAARGPFGRLAGPPSFVLGCFSGLQFGWPGLGSFHSATSLSLLEPVLLGDTIKASCRYVGFAGPKPSRFAGQMVIDEFENIYENQHGRVVARVGWHVINYERGAARKRIVGSDLELPHRWTTQEVEAVEAEVEQEEPRGLNPRWWEDVKVGDSDIHLTKGPISMTDEVAFVAGGGAPIPRLEAHRSALLSYRKHPAWSFRDPTSCALEPIYAVHYNKQAALAMGVPLQYDVGFQRQCWHLHLLSDWMGNAGWIKSANAEYRGFVYHGDVVRLRGEVIAKRVDSEGEEVVDLITSAMNQRGENVMPGRATVALPRRDGDSSPASRRVRERGQKSTGLRDEVAH